MQDSRLLKFQRIALNPWVIISCAFLGGVLGYLFPDASKNLSGLAVVYVDLLKMIVLPFMVSSVIFSVQKLFKNGGAGKIIARLSIVFLIFSVIAAVVALAGSWLLSVGYQMPEDARAALGHIVGGQSSQNNVEMSLYTVEAEVKPTSFQDILASLIPSNVFASLANGETLKALVFALLFGFAVGQVSGKTTQSLEHTLETVYKACQTLTKWINFPVPLVLICMTAGQIAETGIEPMRAMIGFVISFLGVSALLLVLATMVVVWQTRAKLSDVLEAQKEVFSLGVATNNSSICMPAMIEGLAGRLGFSRTRVELLVPLSVTLLRTGAIAYFVCGTIFIADLYGRHLDIPELAVVLITSILSGFASTGMAGLLTISLIGTICGYLGLPFEAAFVLFVAVDPICAMARTAVTTIASFAAVSMICERPDTQTQPVLETA